MNNKLPFSIVFLVIAWLSHAHNDELLRINKSEALANSLFICEKTSCSYNTNELHAIPVENGWSVHSVYITKTNQPHILLVNTQNGEWVVLNPSQQTDMTTQCLENTLDKNPNSNAYLNDLICFIKGGNAQTKQVATALSDWSEQRLKRLHEEQRARHADAMGGEEGELIEVGSLHGLWVLHDKSTGQTIMRINISHESRQNIATIDGFGLFGILKDKSFIEYDGLRIIRDTFGKIDSFNVEASLSPGKHKLFMIMQNKGKYWEGEVMLDNKLLSNTDTLQMRRSE